MQAQRPRQRLESIQSSERTGAAGRPERRPLQSYFAKRPSGPVRQTQRPAKATTA